jgi:hypothetical protein
MTSLRRFTCSDLFNFNSINLDPLTETVRALCATAQTFECLHQTRFHCRPFAAEPLPALTERCPLCSMLSTSTCSTWQHGRSTARWPWAQGGTTWAMVRLCICRQSSKLLQERRLKPFSRGVHNEYICILLPRNGTLAGCHHVV